MLVNSSSVIFDIDLTLLLKRYAFKRVSLWYQSYLYRDCFPLLRSLSCFGLGNIHHQGGSR